eukprot:scaffold36782_cov66-Phaeocystis_antarctica.AAC.4
MVGRRLLDCSDLAYYVRAFKKTAKWIGKQCDKVVNGFKATWDEAKELAVTAVNKAKKLAVDIANTAKEFAEKALVEITSGLTTIGNNIKCAASLLPRH